MAEEDQNRVQLHLPPSTTIPMLTAVLQKLVQTVPQAENKRRITAIEGSSCTCEKLDVGHIEFTISVEPLPVGTQTG